MCLLTFYPANVMPDADALFNGTRINRDGFGYAIVAGNRLIVRRGMNAQDMINKFVKMRRKHPSGPAMFHSRFGTSGKRGKTNCHPFRLGTDRRTVIAHNGVLSNKAVVPDHRCDTRVAAEDILPTWFGDLNDVDNRDDLAEWVGSYNRMVILTTNPAYDQNAYIINESSGKWDNGIWYSNDDYLPYFDIASKRALYDDYLDDCDACGAFGTVDLQLGACDECGSCVGCGEDWQYNCVCLTDSTRSFSMPRVTYNSRYVQRLLDAEIDADNRHDAAARYVNWWEDAERDVVTMNGRTMSTYASDGERLT